MSSRIENENRDPHVRRENALDLNKKKFKLTEKKQEDVKKTDSGDKQAKKDKETVKQKVDNSASSNKVKQDPEKKGPAKHPHLQANTSASKGEAKPGKTPAEAGKPNSKANASVSNKPKALEKPKAQEAAAPNLLQGGVKPKKTSSQKSPQSVTSNTQEASSTGETEEPAPQAVKKKPSKEEKEKQPNEKVPNHEELASASSSSAVALPEVSFLQASVSKGLAVTQAGAAQSLTTAQVEAVMNACVDKIVTVTKPNGTLKMQVTLDSQMFGQGSSMEINYTPNAPSSIVFLNVSKDVQELIQNHETELYEKLKEKKLHFQRVSFKKHDFQSST